MDAEVLGSQVLGMALAQQVWGTGAEPETIFFPFPATRLFSNKTDRLE